MRSAWVSSAVAGVLCLLMAAACGRPAERRPLDVVLVTVDTLRIDHVGAFGGQAASTPAIDRFAARALMFDRAIAPAPFTGPSLSTLLTSHYPHETKVTDNGVPIAAGVLTLTELLHKNGYGTVAVLSNPVLRPPGSYHQGFDVYDTDLPQAELGRPAFTERRADATTDRAIQMLQKHDRSRRLFLWVHYNDPHGPYAPPGEHAQATDPHDALPVNDTNSGVGGIPKYQFIWNERSPSRYRQRYREEVEYLDSEIARLFAVLDEPAFLDHTLVIFTADHGESLGEHGYYFAHGEYLYPELIHVPFMIRGPGLANGHRDDLVGLVDVLPSIAAYLRVPLSAPVRGEAVFEHPARPERALLSSTFFGGSVTDRFAVIRADEELIFSGPSTVELLLDGKPVPVDVQSPNVVGLEESLRRLLAENQLAGVKVPERPIMSKEAADRLRSLGYVR